MKPPEEPPPDKDEPLSTPTRSNEALRMIEEYADDLREIINKLRRRFFN